MFAEDMLQQDTNSVKQIEATLHPSISSVRCVHLGHL